MRVLVAGAGGQLGSALVAGLRAAGADVIAMVRADLDLSSPSSWGDRVAAARPDLVVNAAAYTAVDRAEDDRDAAWAVNAAGAAALAREAAACDAALVHVSTDYVFDGRKGAPYTEEDAPSPTGVYGASKLAGEAAVMACHPRALALRTAWVVSASGHNFLKTMLRLGAERESISVVDDQWGAPTFADDLADAIVRMAPRLVSSEAGDPAFGVFHLTGAPHTTWHGFAEAIFTKTAKRGRKTPTLRPIGTADYPTRAVRPADSRLDCARILAVHGIAAADWRLSLGRCLDGLLLVEGDDGR
ncbi:MULTISPECIES: dTDP-4-dehydrorhamnose reductase [unclassified Chelatococcus]|uniref:dTDP-4-dehydrorhamnose reductase n=1 Tax=unclassified Chelatococcus TaxID=2638111 RepID=UPI001BD0101E|nr:MULTISPECIES: dTDP-4-dehydrorhamnose reductase [unclassified Chelatococcus]CAH1661254.1 dTDP-4-dehydrorhamnose reductase [Hyphomicrobiales bacterium]MBS7741233.1 dTDP-4-dehydrorhamnose reductase [Chelatococcus sp. HY11]MBX3547298.1 dTDP-4-dehydrorhamnose reductase [Chelatococcus sp.]MCO5078055.1 dTDP-4-dehydrorhamnose reductase [Chelatococcus sp.]CAH1683158.1 dTDP-4-dehydrorhamnose reductase [Hyphomicrobiales bacterium]